MSSDNVVDVSYLAGFFDGVLNVDTRTGDGWTFTVTSGDFSGYTIAIDGAGLGDAGDLPSQGFIRSVIVSGPDGDVIHAKGLHILSEQLFEELGSAADDAGDGGHHLIGGDANDTMDGDAGDDQLDGGAGNDLLNGAGGDDTLSGDDGADRLNGGDGDDTENGGIGNDRLAGGGGADDLHGGVGKDNINGGAGGDHLFGDEGKDTLTGGAGADDLHGGAGSDRLTGGAGADELEGDAGNDVLIGGGGRDVFKFGQHFGRDRVLDFHHGQDKLDLSETGLSLNDLTVRHEHGNTFIISDQGTIVLHHVSELQPSDFILQGSDFGVVG